MTINGAHNLNENGGTVKGKLVVAVRFDEKQTRFLQARINETHKTASDVLRGIVDLYIAMTENFSKGAFRFLQENKMSATGATPQQVTEAQVTREKEEAKTVNAAERARIAIEKEKAITAERDKRRALQPYHGARVDWGNSDGLDMTGDLGGER